MAGICYFFKYKEVWADLVTFPRLNLSVLTMEMDPHRTRAGAREATFAVCRAAEMPVYPLSTQQRQKKSSMTQPTKAKSC